MFPLADIMRQYNNRRRELGLAEVSRGTRVKNWILESFGGDMEERGEGNQPKTLVFSEGLNSLIKDVLKKRQIDQDMKVITDCAKMIREDIFNHQGFRFAGSFPETCQTDSLPTSLKVLMSLIINGTSLKNQEGKDNQASLTSGQILYFNVKKRPSPKARTIRHSSEREPPLPIFMGLHIHKEFRSQKLVTMLYQLGISIGYSRVLQLEKRIASSLCERYEKDGVVVPLNLKHNTYTLTAVDNIDWNLSSNQSTTAFHGTCITIHQHPTPESTNQQDFELSDQGYKIELPSVYTNIENVESVDQVNAPPKTVTFPRFDFQTETEKEMQWLSQSQQIMRKTSIDSGDQVSWAGFFSQFEPACTVEPAITGILPLFDEKSTSPAMLKHALKIITSLVHKVNPGQTIIVACDQPIFKVIKQIQWKTAEFNEQRLIPMFGGLHLEMGIFSVIGKLLTDSGWLELIVEAGVTTIGRGQSILSASHIKRTRYVHEVSVCTFNLLKRKAYEDSSSELNYDDWCSEQSALSPTFRYWELILTIQTLARTFVRSLRQRKFYLYVNCLEKIVPFFFSLDAINYSRWVSVHIHDMKMVEGPTLTEFLKGHFTIVKSKHKFSAIAIDQAHEQVNKILKGTGGVIGLFQSQAALTQWLILIPELSRILKEFKCLSSNPSVDEDVDGDDDEDQLPHHEQTPSFQRRFFGNVEKFYRTVTEYGNPFGIQEPNLLTLHTQDVCDSSVVDTIRSIESKGQQQYQSFVHDVLETGSKSINDPISKNAYPLMSTAIKRTKGNEKVKTVKLNSDIFSQAVAVMHNREVSLIELFTYELHFYPPSLANYGLMNFPKDKSDMVHELVTPCINNVPEDIKEFVPTATLILDGNRLIQNNNPKSKMTFNEYAEWLSNNIIRLYFQVYQRIDVVFDQFVEGSMKKSSFEERKQLRRNVVGTTKCPGNWQQFLKDRVNKRNLNEFLGSKLGTFTYPTGRQFFITCREKVLSNCIGSMEDSDHEGADTRIVLHVQHALSQGMNQIRIMTDDTDTVIVALAVYHFLRSQYVFEDIAIDYKMGKQHKSISLKELAESLGAPRCSAIPFLHALTGSDTTSALKTIGKKKALDVLRVYKDSESTLASFYREPFQNIQEDDPSFRILQRLVILMYSRTSDLTLVNRARMELYFQRFNVEKIPPTCNALLFHVKRALFQCGVWSRCLLPKQDLPSPGDYGWSRNEDPVVKWVPLWLTTKEASRECREFVKCTCSQTCTRCKCALASFKCTLLCTCKCTDKVSYN